VEVEVAVVVEVEVAALQWGQVGLGPRWVILFAGTHSQPHRLARVSPSQEGLAEAAAAVM
jgi:hypothetical protein